MISLDLVHLVDSVMESDLASFHSSCDVCWNETVAGGDDVVTDLVMPFDPLAESNDDDTLVGELLPLEMTIREADKVGI